MQDVKVCIEELREWYNGYHMAEVGVIYNPRSIVEALEEGVCRDYWNKTGGYSELKEYITMNFYGLWEAVPELVAGNEIAVDVLGTRHIKKYTVVRETQKIMPGNKD